jgi:2'-5' RNA ligase
MSALRVPTTGKLHLTLDRIGYFEERQPELIPAQWRAFATRWPALPVRVTGGQMRQFRAVNK